MTVVYLDRVVLLNLAVDYLLLLATARLAGLPLRRGCCWRQVWRQGPRGPFSAGYITPTSAGRCCWAPP